MTDGTTQDTTRDGHCDSKTEAAQDPQTKVSFQFKCKDITPTNYTKKHKNNNKCRCFRKKSMVFSDGLPIY